MSRRPDRRRVRTRQVNIARGLTLVEVVVVTAIMALIAGTLVALATAVQTASDFHFGRGLTAQHGRVALQRIERTIRTSVANHEFPGAVVFATADAGYNFPDILVVWRPAGTPADPQGRPRMNELVMFMPNPAAPNELWEVSLPSDARVAPELSDASAWWSELNALPASAAASRVVLTDLVRTDSVDGSGQLASQRAALRFHLRYAPSLTERADLQAGTLTGDDLPWVQDIHSPQTGLAQTWCAIELQLRPGDVADRSAAAAVPFFGSAAVYYSLNAADLGGTP